MVAQPVQNNDMSYRLYKKNPGVTMAIQPIQSIVGMTGFIMVKKSMWQFDRSFNGHSACTKQQGCSYGMGSEALASGAVIRGVQPGPTWLPLLPW